MSARDWALAELDRRRLPGWRSIASRRLHLVPPPGDPRDLALAEHIVVAVVKNLLHLRHLLQYHADRPLERIDPLVAKIVVIGLAQLRCMQRIPASAAVNEAVDQAKRFGRARAAGFVNVVLRNATRNADPPPPDPAADAERYAALVLSHPRELYRRLHREFGAARALEICRHNNSQPPTIVRLLKDVTSDRLVADGVTVSPHARPGMYVVEPARKTVLADWAARGIAQVQDPTAASVVEMLDIRPGQRILDRCAGVGTKTLQIREALGQSGQIVAVDPSAARLKLLADAAASRAIGNVTIVNTDMLGHPADGATAPFDRALVDVPCSNSGVLARRAEARYAQRDHDLRSLAKLQRQILFDTAPLIADGGLLLYSTCSIWPEENEHQVEWFARHFSEYAVEDSRLVLPGGANDPARYHDGGFVAVMRRRTQSPAAG